MKAKNFLLAAVIGLVFGCASGYIGTVSNHYNELHFGTSSEDYRYPWLAFPSLPGRSIAEFCSGYQWDFLEAWHFRNLIRTSNAIFWSLAAICTLPLFAATFSYLLRRSHANTRNAQPV